MAYVRIKVRIVQLESTNKYQVQLDDYFMAKQSNVKACQWHYPNLSFTLTIVGYEPPC